MASSEFEDDEATPSVVRSAAAAQAAQPAYLPLSAPLVLSPVGPAQLAPQYVWPQVAPLLAFSWSQQQPGTYALQW